MKNYSALFCNKYVMLILMLISMGAEADCYTNQSGAVAVTDNIAAANFTVQRDTPVGTTIGTISVPASGQEVLACDSDNSSFYYAMLLFTTPSSISGYYNTNVPGVGVKMSGFSNPATVYYMGIGGNTDAKVRTVEFVKTGDIVSGVTSSGLFAAIQTSDQSTKAVSYNMAATTITQVACAITTPNLSFPIGDVPASSFGTSVGTTPSGAEKTQNLGLNCDAGANINVSLSGTQNPDVATDSVMALTGQGNAGVAGGVGVQLLYNGSPLELNNRIVLKQSSGGQETFPLTARYYQTKTSVTTGSANTSATLTLTYQ
ncbi:MAG TPA: hypothetical protein VGI71_06355 [Scandinavium sp.]|jgi:type 1 fimbria pilin